MWWLVDEATERILRESVVGCSDDGETWVSFLELLSDMNCMLIIILNVQHDSSQLLKCQDPQLDLGSVIEGDHSSIDSKTLRECSVELSWGVGAVNACRVGRFVRAVLQSDMDEVWRVHEVWLRGRR